MIALHVHIHLMIRSLILDSIITIPQLLSWRTILAIVMSHFIHLSSIRKMTSFVRSIISLNRLSAVVIIFPHVVVIVLNVIRMTVHLPHLRIGVRSSMIISSEIIVSHFSWLPTSHHSIVVVTIYMSVILIISFRSLVSIVSRISCIPVVTVVSIVTRA